jgi:hypothetical protein
MWEGLCQQLREGAQQLGRGFVLVPPPPQPGPDRGAGGGRLIWLRTQNCAWWANVLTKGDTMKPLGAHHSLPLETMHPPCMPAEGSGAGLQARAAGPCGAVWARPLRH